MRSQWLVSWKNFRQKITLLMATHYQAMVKHWGEEKANLWLASMGRYAVSPDALEGVKSYEEHVIPVVKK